MSVRSGPFSIPSAPARGASIPSKSSGAKTQRIVRRPGHAKEILSNTDAAPKLVCALKVPEDIPAAVRNVLSVVTGSGGDRLDAGQEHLHLRGQDGQRSRVLAKNIGVCQRRQERKAE